jgi:hypothetical protein
MLSVGLRILVQVFTDEEWGAPAKGKQASSPYPVRGGLMRMSSSSGLKTGSRGKQVQKDQR